MFCHVDWKILTNISEQFTASIMRVMTKMMTMVEPVSSSEMLVNIYQTAWRNIPEHSHL
jgi:hypothetical protein